MSGAVGAKRALVGAILLDFAVSPLFIWDVFTEPLGRDLDASDTALSTVISIGLAAFTSGVLVGGQLADRVAPRRLALATAGAVVGGLGLTAVAQSLLLLVVGFGLLLGVGTGTGYATAVRVASTMVARQGLAVGLVVSAYAAGAVVLSPITAWLLTAVGRAGTFITLAAGLGTALLAAALLLPDVSPRRASPSVDPTATPPRSTVPALWLMFCFGSLPALVAFAHAGDFAGSPHAGVAAVSLLNAGNFVGRLVAGPASDRFGYAPALHVTAACLSAACLSLTFSDHLLLNLAALFVLGTQYGALSALTPIVTMNAVPTMWFGSTYGRVFTGWGAAGLAGPVAAAWLATQTGYGATAGALTGIAVLAWAATMWALFVVRPSRV